WALWRGVSAFRGAKERSDLNRLFSLGRLCRCGLFRRCCFGGLFFLCRFLRLLRGFGRSRFRWLLYDRSRFRCSGLAAAEHAKKRCALRLLGGEGCYLGLLLLGGCGSWGWLRLLLVIGVCRLCHDGGLCFPGVGFRLFLLRRRRLRR